MVLSKEKADAIKAHLFKQLDNFPADRQVQIRSSIENLTVSELEKFLEDQGLSHLISDCIFCSIVNRSSPSFIVGEDDKSLAILELNPLSRGHTLVIPKSHDDGVSVTRRLQKLVAEKLSDRLSPVEIRVSDVEIAGHKAVEVIPLFGGESSRKRASDDDLRSLREFILSPPVPVESEVVPSAPTEVVRVNPRIP